MKTSEVLAAAIPYLGWVQYEDQRYLCLALESAWYHRKISKGDLQLAKKMIAEKLDGSATLEEWLEKHHGIKELEYPAKRAAQMEYEAYCDKMQVTRHAWVDSMIDEFQKKGD